MRSAGALEPVLAEKSWLRCCCRFVISVQNVWIEIDSVRPGDRPGNRVHRGCSEALIVVDRCKHARQGVSEVLFAHEAIRERDTQRSRAEMIDGGHSGERGHGHRLLERVDPREGGWLLREGPVGRELVMVQPSPLLDELRSGPWEVSSDGRAVFDTDQRFVLGVDRMEVRRVVVCEVM